MCRAHRKPDYIMLGFLKGQATLRAEFEKQDPCRVHTVTGYCTAFIPGLCVAVVKMLYGPAIPLLNLYYFTSQHWRVLECVIIAFAAFYTKTRRIIAWTRASILENVRKACLTTGSPAWPLVVLFFIVFPVSPFLLAFFLSFIWYSRAPLFWWVSCVILVITSSLLSRGSYLYIT